MLAGWWFRAPEHGPHPLLTVMFDFEAHRLRHEQGDALQLFARFFRWPAPLLGLFHAFIVVPLENA